MGVHPLRSGEQYWYDRIKPRFMYPVPGAFADLPAATEGAHIPNTRPLRALTSAGKEIVYISSEESVGSSNGELSSWSNIFAGVLRDLGIDPEEKKKKTKKKKVITINADVTSKKGGSSRTAPGAADKGEKKIGAAGSRSSGSAGSRNPDARATPFSLAHDEEEEEEEEEEPTAKLVSRKRSRETTSGASVVQKPGGVPLIGKQSNLRSLYRFSPEAEKEKEKAAGKEKEKKAAEKPVGKAAEKEKETTSGKLAGDAPKETGTAADTARDKAQGPEVVHITGLDQLHHEKRKEPEIEKITKLRNLMPPIIPLKSLLVLEDQVRMLQVVRARVALEDMCQKTSAQRIPLVIFITRLIPRRRAVVLLTKFLGV
ncbi:hypothetical protein HanIR_Chr15g0748301 [Helianthus annuus]|nr:hypothetical protein HanIR_Chr15g0748301 [Helianthus annuus]